MQLAGPMIKTCILFFMLQASSLAKAANWTAQLPCDQILQARNVVETLLRHIKDEASRQIQNRQTTSSNIYKRYVVPITPNSRQWNFNFMVDSNWTFHQPKAGFGIWNQLTETEKLKLLEGLEQAYAQGVYDKTLLPDDDSAPVTLGHFFNSKTIKALRKNLAFSPILFLGGAQQNQPIGVCRHYNLALAALLIELGLPPKDLQIITGTSSNNDPSYSHLYFEIRIEDNWLLSDLYPQTEVAVQAGYSFNTYKNRPQYYHPDVATEIWRRKMGALMMRSEYSKNLNVLPAQDLASFVSTAEGNRDNSQKSADKGDDVFFDELIKIVLNNKNKEPNE